MKSRTILFFIFTFSLTAFGQTAHHTADYYFREGARYLIMPGNHSDSLSKVSLLYYTKSIKADKRFWRAYRNRATIYDMWHQYDKELSDLTLAIKYCTTPERTQLYSRRGIFYYNVGQYTKAVNDINKGIINNGNPAYLYLIRAKANWKSGFKIAACNDYTKAFKMDTTIAKDKEFLNCN